MKNEVLCKVVAHNICCLIMSQLELGIDVQFWGEQKDERAPVEVPAAAVESAPVAAETITAVAPTGAAAPQPVIHAGWID